MKNCNFKKDSSNYIFEGVKPLSYVAFLIASVQHILTDMNSMEAETNLPGWMLPCSGCLVMFYAVNAVSRLPSPALVK